ncbi:acyltransferase [Curtobacterium sp. GD1]|uniref:acyltransferase family protein n=1 Tax=Curtobacterium sp. GD1 TaxID=2810612 RepID=UPI001E4A40FD|nr:acyltransferase [Curtobacterium sp. GD1]MCC8906561.1 acyltransferase [Curtobacterium sp. GD1]
MHFLDPLRIVMFLAVVLNHAQPFADDRSAGDPLAEALFLLSPNGRYLFITITVFLIARSSSTSSAMQRVLVLAWPFLVWSAIYAVIDIIGNGMGPDGAWGLALAIMTGSAGPHLYFVVVTIQLTLLAPLIRALADRSAQRPIALFAVAAIAQFAVVFLEVASAGTDFRVAALCIVYPLYIVGGAVLAANLEAVTAWFRTHTPQLIFSLTIVGVVYMSTVFTIDEPRSFWAAVLLRSVRAAWNLFVALVSVAACMRVVSSTGRLAAVAKRAGAHMQDLGYGLFLAHFVGLHLVAAAIDPVAASLPYALLTVIFWIGGVVATVCLVLVMRRTPLSRVLTGRRTQYRLAEVRSLTG